MASVENRLEEDYWTECRVLPAEGNPGARPPEYHSIFFENVGRVSGLGERSFKW